MLTGYDIFITGILDYNPQVIQSTDLSIFTAVKVTMEETTSLNNLRRQLKVESYPIPSKDATPAILPVN